MLELIHRRMFFHNYTIKIITCFLLFIKIIKKIMLKNNINIIYIYYDYTKF